MGGESAIRCTNLHATGSRFGNLDKICSPAGDRFRLTGR